MEINRDNIIQLMDKENMSRADLARAMNVDRSTVTRILNGTRGAGKDVIAGLLNAFPGISIKELFFFDKVSSNGNTEQTA